MNSGMLNSDLDGPYVVEMTQAGKIFYRAYISKV